MNKHGEIYRAPDDELVPEEDQARLEGFLAARAETDKIKTYERKLQEVLRAQEERDE